MYKIEYNYLKSIIRVILTGHLTLDNIKQLSKELNKSVTNKNNLILTDARDTIFDFEINDLGKLYSFIDDLNKNLIPENLVYEAILINNPRESAITILFNIEKKKFNHIYNIFSTEEVAINWLLSHKV